MAGMKAGSFEKLHDANYHSWEINVRGLLKMKGCWYVVQRPLPVGDLLTREMEMHNDKAEGIILMSVDASAAKEIGKCESAYEMWNKLKDVRGKCEDWYGLSAATELTHDIEAIR